MRNTVCNRAWRARLAVLGFAVCLNASSAGWQIDKNDQSRWQTLFDGKTLADWTPTKFFGEGECALKVDRSRSKRAAT